MQKIKTIIFLLCTFCSLSFSSTPIPAKKQEKPIALIGGTIYPITSAPIENGTLLFENGKITAIGKNITIPTNAEKIDVTGKSIYPGIINALSSAGLIEIESVRGTNDLAEVGPINPNVRTEISINPESELIPTIRANGITLSHVIPKGSLIAGTSSVIMMDGWTQEDLVLQAPTGLVIYWPRMTTLIAPWYPKTEEEQKKEREENLQKIKNVFADARAYWKAKKNSPFIENDTRWESMLPVLEKKIPVMVYANEMQQILSAIQWAKEENVSLIILGGYDSWRVADVVKKNNIPIIVGAMHNLPTRAWEAYNTIFELPKRLYEAGIFFAISGEGATIAGETMYERNIPYQAASAVAYGLPSDMALQLITINAAKILGIDKHVGSLEIAKDATLIVTNGNPLEITTNVEMEFIQGKKIDLRSRHTELYHKYQEKYQQLGIKK